MRQTIVGITVTCILIALAGCDPRPTEPESAVTSGGAAPVVDELPAALREGRTLYVANGCESCHGKKGLGDGPAGLGINPRPRNFRETAAYKQGSSEDAVVRTLFSGVPGTLMMPYPQIKESDRRLIARYVVYLQQQSN